MNAFVTKKPRPEYSDEDMANVGRALMERLPDGYSYMNCPSEIVTDLQNEIADLKSWFPISTAPQDGTVIDLFCAEDDERYTDCFWGHTEHTCGEAGQYCDSEWHSEQPGWVWGTLNEQISNVTHWMPRPATPVT